MHHPNLEKLKALKLFGMARALEDLHGLHARGRLDFADPLALLIDREAADRANIALASRLKRAQLRQVACFENIDLKAARAGQGPDPRPVHLPLDQRSSPSDHHRGPERHGSPAPSATRRPGKASACSTRGCRACSTISPPRALLAPTGA